MASSPYSLEQRFEFITDCYKNMLILANDYDMAEQLLTLYENTVFEYEGSQTFD